MEKYANRRAAGRILAQTLIQYAHQPDVIVLALPRGGVPVGFEITQYLHVPLDVLIVRKLGAPDNAELAIGAIALNTVPFYNQDLIQALDITQSYLEATLAQEQQELKRRNLAYRGHRSFPVLRNKTVILVDDGIATGATMQTAINAVRALEAHAIIIAVPVADRAICQQLQPLVTALICPIQPVHFFNVGSWYEDFAQLDDIEVINLLSSR